MLKRVRIMHYEHVPHVCRVMKVLKKTELLKEQQHELRQVWCLRQVLGFFSFLFPSSPFGWKFELFGGCVVFFFNFACLCMSWPQVREYQSKAQKQYDSFALLETETVSFTFDKTEISRRSEESWFMLMSLTE